MDSKTAKTIIKDRCAEWGNDYAAAVEEVTNTRSADLIAVEWGGRITEFEIKVSRSDLRGEVRAIFAAMTPGIMRSMDVGYGSTEKRWYITPDTKLSRTKIDKHHHYIVETHREHDRMAGNNWVMMFKPHRFYFAVPGELVEYAKELLKPIKQYGVYCIETGKIEKRAYALHTEQLPSRVYFDLLTRACTERNHAMRDYRIAQDKLDNGVEVFVRHPYKYAHQRHW